MGVSLPSDLVLDVMRSADPARLTAAASKLQALDGGEQSEFASLLDGVDVAPSQQQAADLASADTAHDPHVAFERMVLRNLMESLLPDAGSGAFGTGPSAGAWRSMAADQLAGVYAGSGGLGIAQSLSSRAEGEARDTGLQWPYFDGGKIQAFAG